ncbi:J domain-containing protein [Aquimarina algiphila]|uniref:J domain-containing protein n=1 Tax=Aquimarina algiphila TaxID=2047982 RepID=A0A554VID1_9FLAO|nr:DnaJ domain-containing protein [Aquimarina algiphila]TSE07407.1 J domain-containing protein [Aquimarina algiphila]
MNVYDAARILGLTGEINPKIVKKAFREASKKYHPDVNPAGEELMKMINEAYEVLKDYSGESKDEQSNYSDLLSEALNAIIHLDDLMIEICGAWIWITGNTKVHKTVLKEAGFYWASKKKAWYFRPEAYRSKHKGSKSMDHIRTKYGSVTPARHTNSHKTLKPYDR